MRKATLSALCASLVAVYYFYRFKTVEESPKTISKIEWRHDEDFVPSIISKSEPVVLIRTPFDAWPSRKWTPEYLSSKIQFIMTKKSKEKVFKYFAQNQPLTSVQGLVLENKTYSEVVMTGKQFIEKAFGLHDGNYYYASGPVDQLDLRQDVGDVNRLAAFANGSESPATVNLWMGSAGVTAHTHYDTSHNFHAVLWGRKRFYLLPPRAHSLLKLYPCLHQFYRQVQENLFDLNSSVLEVDLLPGDVLYIPPYWFHAVVTVEATLSLNVWSVSREYLAMEKAYSMALPLDRTWPKLRFAAASRLYVEEVLALLERQLNQTPVDFIESVYSERYEALLDVDARAVPAIVDLEVLRTRLSAAARDLADVIVTGHDRSDRPHVLEINVGNWVEHMALTSVLFERDWTTKDDLKSFYVHAIR